MAFWQSAGASSCQRRAAAEPARPVTLVLHAAADFSSLVRMRVKLPAYDAMPDDEEDEAAQQAAAAARGTRLQQAILGVEASSSEAHAAAITEVLDTATLQLLCQKSAVARVYKSLLPHQARLACQLGDVKSCISLAPLGLWELHEALQTALVKALTGSSAGAACADSSSGGSDACAAPPPAGAAGTWMCLSRQRLAGSNLLLAQPGAVATAPFVELEAAGQLPNKLLLTVRAAGTLRFRPFSPMQVLATEPRSLAPPLLLADSDASLAAEPAKLAAAARQLDGRPVKLLPDERLAFIKSLSLPGPGSNADALAAQWLGGYGLVMPPTYPFLVGVASHPEAEEAAIQVPSCCVLTNMGLCVLPGSAPGGAGFQAVLQQVLDALCSSRQLQMFGAGGLRLEAAHAGTSCAGGPASQAGGTQQAPSQLDLQHASQQPRQFALSTSWTTAKQLGELQASLAASQTQQAGLTPAAVQLMGLDEAAAADAAVEGGGGNAAAASNSSQRRRQQDWSSLKAFLAEREKNKQLASSQALQAGSVHSVGRAPQTGRPPRAGPAAGPQQLLPGRRKLAPPPAAAPKPPVGGAAAADGGAAAGAAAAAPAAASRAAVPAGPPRAPALLKRPGPAAAAAKPPAAKKPKAAAGTGPKPRASKKPPAAAGAAGAATGAAAPAVAAVGTAGPPAAATSDAAAPAAEQQQQQRKRTKAADLDVAAVAAKVAAAYAASGGASLKGVNVAEMTAYLRSRGVKGGSAKRADVEARLLALLAGGGGTAAGGAAAQAQGVPGAPS